MMLIFLKAELMEVNVDSTVINEMIILDNFPPIPLPLTIKTPILEIVADYGNPIVDWFMVVSVIAIIYIIKKVVDKWKK